MTGISFVCHAMAYPTSYKEGLVTNIPSGVTQVLRIENEQANNGRNEGKKQT